MFCDATGGLYLAVGKGWPARRSLLPWTGEKGVADHRLWRVGGRPRFQGIGVCAMLKQANGPVKTACAARLKPRKPVGFTEWSQRHYFIAADSEFQGTH